MKIKKTENSTKTVLELLDVGIEKFSQKNNTIVKLLKKNLGKSLVDSEGSIIKTINPLEFLEKCNLEKKNSIILLDRINLSEKSKKKTLNLIKSLSNIGFFSPKYSPALFLNLAEREKKIEEFIFQVNSYKNNCELYMKKFIPFFVPSSDKRGGIHISIAEHMKSIKERNFEEEALLQKIRAQKRKISEINKKIEKSITSKVLETFVKYSMKFFYIESYTEIYKRFFPKYIQNIIFPYLSSGKLYRMFQILENNVPFIMMVYVYMILNIIFISLIILFFIYIIKALHVLFVRRKSIFKKIKEFVDSLKIKIKKIFKYIKELIASLKIIFFVTSKYIQNNTNIFRYMIESFKITALIFIFFITGIGIEETIYDIRNIPRAYRKFSDYIDHFTGAFDGDDFRMYFIFIFIIRTLLGFSFELLKKILKKEEKNISKYTYKSDVEDITNIKKYNNKKLVEQYNLYLQNLTPEEELQRLIDRYSDL